MTKGDCEVVVCTVCPAFFSFAADADRARKHGMEEFIAADPITFDHNLVFAELQTLALDWRLKDPFASLVNEDCVL